MRIYIAAYDCWSAGQIGPEPEGEGVTTLGLAPRAAHFSQNWYYLAPTGR